MTIILFVVIVIKCIPKYKLPYCLGGTREQESFVCIKDYAKWCAINNIPQVLTSKELRDKNKAWAVDETSRRLNIDKQLLKPF